MQLKYLNTTFIWVLIINLILLNKNLNVAFSKKKKNIPWITSSGWHPAQQNELSVHRWKESNASGAEPAGHRRPAGSSAERWKESKRHSFDPAMSAIINLYNHERLLLCTLSTLEANMPGDINLQ